MSNRKKIMIFSDWYEPGYKAGGPIQSCKNIVNRFHDQYQFYIVTSDRDFGDSTPYAEVLTDTWVTTSNGSTVWYASPGPGFHTRVLRLLQEVLPDIIYLNSMFSVRFTLIPLLISRKVYKKPDVILAPRGMLQQGAISRKYWKKRIFFFLFSKIGVARSLVFHATDRQEMTDIEKFFKKNKQVRLASNIPNLGVAASLMRGKKAGILRCIYFSRIDPKKNLLLALKILKSADPRSRIDFDIFGPIDNETYFESCVSEASTMPSAFTVKFMGPLNPVEVFDVLCRYHLFFLPTKGENFGHAIFEALSAGCPVLISDQTPWTDVEKERAGWALPLDHANAFAEKINEVCLMGQPEFDQLSRSACQYANDYVLKTNIDRQYQDLFQ